MKLLTCTSKKPYLRHTLDAHLSAEQAPNIPIPQRNSRAAPPPARLQKTGHLLVVQTRVGTRRASEVLGRSHEMVQVPED